MSENNDNYTWEAAKENILPTKKGRSIGGLKDNLKTICSEEKMLKATEENYLSQLKMESSIVSKVELYGKFISWARENFPKAPTKEKEVLERFITELKQEKTLYNNIQYVKLWIEYADLVKDQAETFTFMYTNKIGERLALFWIAWAYVAERDGNHKAADQIFQKGVRRAAEPKDVMLKRYHQFQRRIARQFLNSSLDGSASSASSTALPSANDREVSRKRRVGLQDTIPQPQQIQTERPPQRPRIATSSTQSEAPARQSVFQIFDDTVPQAASAAGSQVAPEVKEWKNFGKEAERKKENQGAILLCFRLITIDCLFTLLHAVEPAAKWCNAAIQPLSSSITSTVSSMVSAPPVIPIFVDEEFSSAPAATAVAPPSRAKVGFPSRRVATSQTAVASAVAVVSCTSSDMPGPVPAAAAASKAATSSSRCLWLSSVDDLLTEENFDQGTINTRLARQDIDDMFQSPPKTLAARSSQQQQQPSRGLGLGIESCKTGLGRRLGREIEAISALSCIKVSAAHSS
jgi:hypothetical protein